MGNQPFSSGTINIRRVILTEHVDSDRNYQVQTEIDEARTTEGEAVQLFWLSFGFGLVTASVLAISAVGLSLQFGITNYINFAYGDFMALGAYMTYVVNNELLHWNIWVAIIFGALSVGVIAVILSRLILSPFARRFDKTFYVLIVTFGLSLILLNVMYSIWGASVRFYNVPINRALHIGPMLLTAYQMIVMVIAVVLMIGVAVLS